MNDRNTHRLWAGVALMAIAMVGLGLGLDQASVLAVGGLAAIMLLASFSESPS